MTYEYGRVETPSSGLRLHLNENTSGCSPAVIEVLRRTTGEDAAFYPDYSAAIAACAGHLRVDEASLLLTNGLDEGILAASVAALRGGGEENPFEAIVVVPAFDMYAACADAAGGRVIEVPLGENFAFPLQRVLDAITGRTRIVFLTNPNNPTGIVVPRGDILAIADAAPGATIFLDEAYADFSDTTLIGDAAAAKRSNIVIGRTFAKAYGLAGLRIGALVATPERLAPLRRVCPLTASTRSRPWRCRPPWETPLTTRRTWPRRASRNSFCTRHSIGSGSDTGPVRPISCWRDLESTAVGSSPV